MPSRRDDDRPDRGEGRRGPRPPSRGGRPRSDRARRDGDAGGRGDGPRSGSSARGGASHGGARGGAARGRGGNVDRDRSYREGRREGAGPGGRGTGSERGRPGREDRRDGGRPPRDQDDRRGGRDGGGRPARGPRPPIKGKRRTFDIDSTPNDRERRRLDGDPAGEERWVDEGPVRRAADDAVRRGAGGSRPPRGKGTPARDSSGRGTKRRADRAAKRAEGVLEIDRDRLRRRLGQARADRTLGRIGEATAAYAEDRFEDARKVLKPIADLIPEEPAVRELHGLALYRLGRWRKAAEELEEFTRLTGSTEQHPVLADCYRALHQHDRVEELWDEIGEASLAAPLVAEGRIVYAGSLADQGRVVDAIGVLEAGALGSKNLKDHHLRMRYVLGDLYDRAGDHQAARRWFESVAAAAPGFFDVQDRLRQL